MSNPELIEPLIIEEKSYPLSVSSSSSSSQLSLLREAHSAREARRVTSQNHSSSNSNNNNNNNSNSLNNNLQSFSVDDNNNFSVESGLSSSVFVPRVLRSFRWHRKSNSNKVFIYFQVVFLVFVSIYLILQGSEFQSSEEHYCKYPLHIWLIISGSITLSFSFIFIYLIYYLNYVFNPNNPNINNNRNNNNNDNNNNNNNTACNYGVLFPILFTIFSLLCIVSLIWFIVGNCWLFTLVAKSDANNGNHYNSDSGNNICDSALWNSAWWIIIGIYTVIAIQISISLLNCCYDKYCSKKTLRRIRRLQQQQFALLQSQIQAQQVRQQRRAARYENNELFEYPSDPIPELQ